ncbi:ABC transporter ATP-binding protein [Couchioplanes caeruleus]|uniref:Multidrug ABC transporter permease n=2 Tax=Couchioplanes caeruleus TaxID=56438 RepID=A0A1K0FN12_9ACTN|nr:ABC transporter ATP-binding protein [Couchioplanes caeruleus]OJF14112.1 multidrug ABC transporter permease [Couchioplanes caeruleus subsp. caeruleus]ROP30190.1 ABC-type multidrug transport system fused ATPase/permease subunit [Couchioplanes caeruleus]
MRDLPPADPGSPDHRSATRYLGWLARRTWVSVSAAILFAVVWMVCQAFVPAVIGRAIDAGLTERDGRELLIWSMVLLTVGLVQAGAGLLRHRRAVFNWLSAAYRTVQVAVRQAGRLGVALPRRLDAGEVVAIGTADITHIGNAIDITARGVGSVVAVLTVTTILLLTSVPLGLVVVLGIPVLMAVVSLLIRPLHRRQQAYREQQGRLTAHATDLVGGLRVLRGVGGEPVMSGRYRAESQRLRAAGVRVAWVECLLDAAQVLLPGIFLVLVTWLGARFAISGRITVGQLVSFYGYAAFLVSPLRQLTETIDKLTRGHVSGRRVVSMLRVRSDLRGPSLPRPAPERGELVDPVSGVVVRPGMVTAIAAAVPADAVTIADRLGHYTAAGAGTTLAGVPLKDLDLASVRERIVVADNDARLFSGPLREDLDPEGTGRALAALAEASAADVVEALPDGLDSEVAERGRSFSGGQQQRLRLARALVADPEILVLVEPTSAVDAHTEARIAARLGAARHGRTTVVCSTSPLVLDRADHVLYVEDGVVIAEGTHRELLDGSFAYARTVLRE